MSLSQCLLSIIEKDALLLNILAENESLCCFFSVETHLVRVEIIVTPQSDGSRAARHHS
jgi:hypothetical protein